MSIQSVSNTASNPYVNNLANDFQTLQNDVQALKSSQSSGNSDSVTLSQDALNKAMTQVQNDIASLTQGAGAQSAQGHHHHHHHGMDAADGSTSPAATGLSATTGNSYGSQSQNSAGTINLTA
jgi:hypothetical protein